MVGWHHQLNGHEFEQTLGDSKGQRSLVCCSPWGHKESDTTWSLNNNSNLGFGLIHFELIFVYGMRKCSNFILLHLTVQFSQHHLLKGLFFVHCIFLPPVLLIYCKHGGLFLSSLVCSINLCVYVFVPVPYCFDHCSFVIDNLKSGTLMVSPTLFSQNCFGNLGSLWFHVNFRLFFLVL